MTRRQVLSTRSTEDGRYSITPCSATGRREAARRAGSSAAAETRLNSRNSALSGPRLAVRGDPQLSTANLSRFLHDIENSCERQFKFSVRSILLSCESHDISLLWRFFVGLYITVYS